MDWTNNQGSWKEITVPLPTAPDVSNEYSYRWLQLPARLPSAEVPESFASRRMQVTFSCKPSQVMVKWGG